jgi:hypothetical protein
MDSPYLAQVLQQMQAMGQATPPIQPDQRLPQQPGADRKALAEVLRRAGGAIAGAPQALMRAPGNAAGIFDLARAMGRQ